MNKFYYALCVFCFVATSQHVLADDMVKSAVGKAIDAGFSELEREIIGKYYKKEAPVEEKATTSKKDRKKSKKSKGGLPPGLAKKDKLPPGLEKQLQKNGTLPPGLAKRGLPDDLESQLPAPPEGYERQVVEDAAVVLINKATGKVVDIIKDIVLGKER
jgi:hypothetical protein